VTYRDKRLQEIGQRILILGQLGAHDGLKEIYNLALETLRLLEEKETGREWF
jgi:butyrate kinase